MLVVDNYDSFTYNLAQALEVIGAQCEVALHDAIDPRGVRERRVDGVVISPGPCAPEDAGASVEIIEELAGEVPILGVCLGHQAIAQVFGGRVGRAERVVHGKTSRIEHDGRTVFRGLPVPFEATRYNSLLVDPEAVPGCLEVSAWTAEGEVMGVRHRALDVEGVQFHPESILTAHGPALLRNWVEGLGQGGRGRATRA